MFGACQRSQGLTPKKKVTNAFDVYLQQYKGIGKQMQKIVEPVLKQQEDLQRAVRPFLESHAAIQKSLGPIFAAQDNWHKALLDISQYALPDFGPLTKQLEEVHKSIEGIINPVFRELQRSFSDLPPRTKKALILLGEHGWYFDLDMPLPNLWRLEKALEEGSVKEA